MTDDKDREIARLKAALGEGAEPQPASPKDRSKPWQITFLVVVAAVVGFVALAWSHGRDLAQRDEAIAGACGAVAADAAEKAGCVESMDREYKGDLTPERTVNAAAEHVRPTKD